MTCLGDGELTVCMWYSVLHIRVKFADLSYALSIKVEEPLM